MEDGGAAPRRHVGQRAGREEELHDVGVALVAGDHEAGVVVLVGDVEVGAARDQELDDRKAAPEACRS